MCIRDRVAGGRPQPQDKEKLGRGARALQTGSDEPVHHVHERQHHLHLPHHDGHHDERQASQDALLGQTNIQVSRRGGRWNQHDR